MVSSRYLPYVLIACAHLAGISWQVTWLTQWTKPLLIPLLALAFYSNASVRSGATWQLVCIFLFSWLGDVLLQFSGTTYFLAGLGSFLLAQISYTSFFIQYPPKGLGSLASKPWGAIPYLLYLICMLWFLWPGLDAALRIPVAVYSVFLVGMGLSAFGFRQKTKAPWGWWIVLGSILFVLSDSLIALDRFSDMPVWHPRFSIMITYILAQGLLIYGIDRTLRPAED
jgi:uncharacterized membrane protein YhhN